VTRRHSRSTTGSELWHSCEGGLRAPSRCYRRGGHQGANRGGAGGMAWGYHSSADLDQEPANYDAAEPLTASLEIPKGKRMATRRAPAYHAKNSSAIPAQLGGAYARRRAAVRRSWRSSSEFGDSGEYGQQYGKLANLDRTGGGGGLRRCRAAVPPLPGNQRAPSANRRPCQELPQISAWLGPGCGGIGTTDAPPSRLYRRYREIDERLGNQRGGPPLKRHGG